MKPSACCAPAWIRRSLQLAPDAARRERPGKRGAGSSGQGWRGARTGAGWKAAGHDLVLFLHFSAVFNASHVFVGGA